MIDMKIPLVKDNFEGALENGVVRVVKKGRGNWKGLDADKLWGMKVGELSEYHIRVFGMSIEIEKIV